MSAVAPTLLFVHNQNAPAVGAARALVTECFGWGAERRERGLNIPVIAESSLSVNSGAIAMMGTDHIPTIHAIQQAVCARFRVRLIDMLSRRRDQRIARPRQVAMWIVRQTTLHSLPEIGRAFGDRDHTTVIHALKVIERLITSDYQFASVVWELVQDIDSIESVSIRRAMIRMVA